MRAQLICTTLLASLLCTTKIAHPIVKCESIQSVHLQTMYNTPRLNRTWLGELYGRWETGLRRDTIETKAHDCDNEKSLILNFVAAGRNGEICREVPVWRLADSRAFFFVAGMTIDADGSPNAYNAEDTGLDALANAGTPSHWDGIVTDRAGQPLIQQAGDPFPGYYVSCTTLADTSKPLADPRRYVDATKIPYVVLPKDVADRGGAGLGDFAFVMNLRNGRSSFAIYADIGTLGEGSIALGQALGIHFDARLGGTSDGVLYVVFPDSGDQQPRTVTDIEREGERQMSRWHGIEVLSTCADEKERPFRRGITALSP